MYKLSIPKSIGIVKAARLCAGIILISAFVLSFLTVPLWDYDFWWHIATGRYIVETGSLPEKDLFSYTSTLAENKNVFPVWENFILKQYWLSQIIFYLIYDYTGPKGIIILRTVLLVLTLLIVFWRLQRWSVSFPVSFIFVFTLFTLLTRSTGERPVLFTIFFTALAFFMLDDFKDNKGKKIFLLIPIMLLWSNLHGGFIIGIIIIVVFMLGKGINIFLKKGTHTKKEIFLFYSAAVLAIAASFVNPTGWDAFSVAINIPFKYKAIHVDVQEYQSLLFYYRNKIYPIHYGYVFLALMFPIVVMLRNKNMAFTHLMLLAGFFIMSISAGRFVVYYAILAAMIIGKESDILIKNLLARRFSEETYKKIINALTIAALLSTILFLVGIHMFEMFKFKIASGYSVPVAAVDFIERNRLSGNMFNKDGYGGYFAWRLYPRQKTFFDTRSLNITVKTEYGWIVGARDFTEEVAPSIRNTPLWERLLNHYKVNYIFETLVDMYGSVQPLVLRLTESDNWIPVYCDPISVIFVRNNAQNQRIIKKFKLSKDDVYNIIILKSSFHAMADKINPRYLTSIGEAFYKMGRINDAVKAYEYALKRMPESPVIKERLDQMKSEQK